ncbi:MAG: hypothetical protein HY806_08295 [Nitrospirae bacterium]|nr:hypothetical protein [Nitrospirota bacterium]
MNRQAIFYGILSFLLVFFYFTDNRALARISGQVQLTYDEEENNREGSITELTSIKQKYRINYTNFLYDPRLLNYSIGGIFSREDNEADGTETDMEATDYDVRLYLLNSSHIPITLWTSKNTTTSFLPQADGTVAITEQKQQSVGLSGNYFKRGAPRLRYGFTQENKEITGTQPGSDERTRTLSFGIHHGWKSSTVHMDYAFTNVSDKVLSTAKTVHDVGAGAETSSRLSRAATLSSNIGFHTNTYDEFSEFVYGSGLSYNPAGNISGAANIGYTHTDQTGGTADAYTGGANAVYSKKLSNFLVNTETASVNFNRGETGDTTTEALSGTLNYGKQIARNLAFSANTGVGLEAQQGEDITKTMLKSDIASTLTRDFPMIKSQVSTGGALNYMTSSAGGRNQNYSLNLNLICACIEHVTAQSQLVYAASETREDTEDSAAATPTVDRSLISDSSVAYSIPLGWRTTMEAKAGAVRESGTTSKNSYYTEGSLSSALRRNLFLKSNLRKERENTIPNDNVAASVSLDYRIRLIFVNLRYEYRREEAMSAVNKRQATFLQVSRPF